MNDFFSSLKVILIDRIRSPLYGALFFSWITINWKLLFIAFSVEYTTSLKIVLIQENLKEWQFTILYPIISSLVIIFIVPLFNVGVIYITGRYKKLQIEASTNSEGQTRLSEITYSQMQLSIKDEIKRYEDRISQLESNNKLIRNENDQLHGQIQEFNKEIPLLKDTISQKELTLEREFIQSRKQLSSSILLNKTLCSEFEKMVKANKDELIDSSYLFSDNFHFFLETGYIEVEDNVKQLYKITNEGKTLLKLIKNKAKK